MSPRKDTRLRSLTLPRLLRPVLALLPPIDPSDAMRFSPCPSSAARAQGFATGAYGAAPMIPNATHFFHPAGFAHTPDKVDFFKSTGLWYVDKARCAVFVSSAVSRTAR